MTLTSTEYATAPSVRPSPTLNPPLQLHYVPIHSSSKTHHAPFQISRATLAKEPSPRIVEIARPRPFPDGYKVPRPCIWQVSEGARRAETRVRFNELAVPRSRASMTSCLYDPDAFNVKPQALKAICSPRTEELAQPKVYSK